jgi:azurin
MRIGLLRPSIAGQAIGDVAHAFTNDRGPMHIVSRRHVTSRPLSVAFRRLIVLTLLFAPTVLPSPLAAQAPAAAPRTIEIIGGDDMKYDKTTIQAKPGEQIRIRLTAKGSMPKIAMSHNVVVLQLKTDAAAFVTAGMAARATDYIAPANKAQVIAATKLAGNGETVEVTFKVPTAPGSYPYVCTFPGHFAAGMKGSLIVKK